MDLFSYGDYRHYIRDYFLRRKQESASFSMARLGQRVGLSKVAVKYVMDGQRHIADDSIAQWATCLELCGNEAQFFHDLVLFNKARSHSHRTVFFNRMLTLKDRGLRCRLLDASTAGYFQAWYYPAIAELSYVVGFEADPEWIRKRLRFSVSIAKIRKALSFLDTHGYLKGAAATGSMIKAPDEFGSHVYKSFVLEQIALGASAVEQQSVADREVFTLTVSVDDAKYAALKTRLAEIRHELHELAASLDPADRVIQINMQMFTVAVGDVHEID